MTGISRKYYFVTSSMRILWISNVCILLLLAHLVGIYVACIPLHSSLLSQSFDFSAALRTDMDGARTKPINQVLCRNRKRMVVAVDDCRRLVKSSSSVTVVDVGALPGNDSRVDAFRARLLEHDLCLFEMDESDCSVADGLVAKIINSCARFSLIVVVFASKEKSICYVKTKT